MNVKMDDSGTLLLSGHITTDPYSAYSALLDESLLPKWLGPRDLELTVVDFDPTGSGNWQCDLRAPDGRVFVIRGTYLELKRPQIIRYSQVTEHPVHDFETTVDISIVPDADGCFMTVSIELTNYEALMEYLGAEYIQQGFVDTWNRLKALLER